MIQSRRMTDGALILAVHQRLGVQIMSSPPLGDDDAGYFLQEEIREFRCQHSSCIKRNTMVDMHLSHAYVCSGKCGISTRHNNVVTAVKGAVIEMAGHRNVVVIEEPLLLNDPILRKALRPEKVAAVANRVNKSGQKLGMNDLRADLRIRFPGSTHADIILDMVITHPQAQDGIEQAAAVLKQEKRKREHYSGYFTETAAKKITPFAVDTFGMMSPAAYEVIRQLVGRFGKGVTHSRNQPIRRYYEQISVALLESNYDVVRDYVTRYAPSGMRPQWLQPGFRA
jgi:hypothetical protein